MEKWSRWDAITQWFHDRSVQYGQGDDSEHYVLFAVVGTLSFAALLLVVAVIGFGIRALLT